MTGINASGLNDGTVTYSVTETAGSNTTTATATASKDLANITEAGTVVTYTAGPGVNNNVSVTMVTINSISYFVFNDTAEALYSSITGELNSGTNTVDIPTSAVTGITLSLGNGADAISSTGVVLAAQSLTISNTGTGLTINGAISTNRPVRSP